MGPATQAAWVAHAVGVAVPARVVLVAVEVRVGDLILEPTPGAQTVIANVPPEVHAALAHRLAPETTTLLASGVLATAADDTVTRYADAGFVEAGRSEHDGWAVLKLSRALPG